MNRQEPSLDPRKPTWIAQKRHTGQVEYYPIIDPIETQQLLYDVMKFLIYGYVYNTKYDLDPYAAPWYPRTDMDCKNNF